MRPEIYVFDTGTGPNLIRADMVELYWVRSVRVSEKPRLKGATSQHVETIGTIILHVFIGEAHVRVAFGILNSLVVSVLLGTSFMENF